MNLYTVKSFLNRGRLRVPSRAHTEILVSVLCAGRTPPALAPTHTELIVIRILVSDEGGAEIAEFHSLGAAGGYCY